MIGRSFYNKFLLKYFLLTLWHSNTRLRYLCMAILREILLSPSDVALWLCSINCSSFRPGIKDECTVGRDFFCDLEKKTCIDLSKTCDGVNNCPNATDEGPACQFSSCKSDNGGCTQVCYTTPAGKLLFKDIRYNIYIHWNSPSARIAFFLIIQTLSILCQLFCLKELLSVEFRYYTSKKLKL